MLRIDSFILHSVGVLYLGLTSCGRFESKLWGPESTSLTPALDISGSLDGDFSPNIGYLTVYDHPTILVGNGSYSAKNVELTFVDKPSVSEVNCDAEGGADPNIAEVAAAGSASAASKKITFRRVSSLPYFEWKYYQNTDMLVEETLLTSDDGSGSSEPISLSPNFDADAESDLAAVYVFFGNVDTNQKLIEGEITIENPLDPEAEASFAGSDEATYLAALGGTFVVKYCADLNGAENPLGP